ncbi:MAG: GAF domain-containing protein [Actinophytocola sp.]|nr:GAF domain-containing protein [Actinophytocola sp.]
MDTNEGATRTRRYLARLLELLAEEAPPELFDQLGDEVTGDREVAALARAGRIRRLLADRKRREREMQALLDTAGDLASLREVDRALDAIAARARQLLGTDAAYLALVDPAAGDVRMRVTLGTVSRPIESLRQPPGSGVGGRVVQTGRPYATANYQRDTTIKREPAVSAAVAEDGIVSVLGAPLRAGDDVIGVLFGANRDERAFEQSEVDLLCSLADHAAIVLENARLFGEAEITAEKLGAANEQLTRRNHALEQTAAAHERLMTMVLRQADLAELVEAVAGILGGAVVAVRPEGTPLASAAPHGHEAPLSRLPAACQQLAELPPPTRPGGARRLGPPPDSGPSIWAVPVQAGSEPFGHLLFAPPAEPVDTDVRILERSAQTAALLLLVERQAAEAAQQVRGQFVDELLAEREPDWSALRRRADQSAAIDFTVPHTVLVLSVTGTTRRRLLRAVADFAAARSGVATEHSGHAVLVLPRADDSAARSVREHLERALAGRITMGVAGPATSAPAVRAAHREARRCHELLLALSRDGTEASMADLGALGLVFDGTSREEARQLVDDTVGPITEYDTQHGTLLTETLDAYFAAGRNPRAAARALRVHPNTVYQRLDRVDQVLGHRDWREPSASLTMQIALQLRRVLDQMPTRTQVAT